MQAREREEELMGEAPEDFVDPIMQTLMLDPDRLPTGSLNPTTLTIGTRLRVQASRLISPSGSSRSCSDKQNENLNPEYSTLKIQVF